MNPSHDSSADDLRPVVDLLRARRPEATPLELDAVKQRVMRRAAASPAGRRARSATLMKSRLAILSMLVAGMLLSTTGAGLAVTSVTGNAAGTQYHHGGGGAPGGTQGTGHKGGTLGEGAQGGPTTTTPSTPTTTTTTTATNTAVQPTRQLETGAGSGQLPFTGFLAIPVLLGGLVLLTAGLVLRRRAAR